MVLQMLDFDMGKEDEVAGTMVFSIKKLIELGSQPGGHFYWQNMYGGPITKGVLGATTGGNKAYDMMNQNPELGSSWKGRMLMQIEATDSKHPERRDQQMDPEIR